MEVLIRAVLAHPIERVWSLVGNFSELQVWSPSVQHCKCVGSGVGSYRLVTTSTGTIHERLDELDDIHYRLVYTSVSGSTLPMENVQASIHLQSLSTGATEVAWRVSGDPTKDETEARILLQGRYAARLVDLSNTLALIGPLSLRSTLTTSIPEP